MISKLRQQPVWIALIIFVLLCLWIASGSLVADEAKPQKAQLDAPKPKVRVTRMFADQVNREISLYGRTEPDRSATLRSEIKGQVVDIFVQEGEIVSKGQKLLALDANDLVQRLDAAKAMLKQRQIELQGAQSLEQKGYQSQATLAQAQANVDSAKAQVKGLELDIENTIIVAPFDGVLDHRHVEIGDLLRDGDNIAIVVDLDPLIVSADVTERDINSLSVGQRALGRMVSGQTLEGTIRYISSMSNEGTNTFKIEVAVPNAEGVYKAGMSTELAIPLRQTYATKITPAVMALDESGNLGVKVVEGTQVRFIPIDIVKSDSEGVWLSGLGAQADVITLGHGFVRDGDEVEVVYSDDNSAQAN